MFRTTVEDIAPEHEESEDCWCDPEVEEIDGNLLVIHRDKSEAKMTQYYVGVKIIEAWEEEKDGKAGYAVKYPDGYRSWSPKDTFEAAYFPMGLDPSTVNPNMVEDFLGSYKADQFDEKTTIVTAETLTGFRQYEVSSCVDPKNFDMQIGTDIGLRRIKDTLWKCLGFVVQWGRFGLKR